MSHRSSAARLFVEGLVVGGAAGLLAGLLMAPDEGREARRRVAYLMDRWTDGLGQLVERLGGQGGTSEARHDAAALVSDAREQAAQLLHEADALISEVRQRRSAPGRPDGGA